MSSESPINTLPSWDVAPLKDVTLKIGSGSTPRGGAASYLKERTEYALVRSQNVFDNHFNQEGLAFISNAQALEMKNVHLQSGDVLLNITGDGVTFGRATIVPDEVLPACVNQHVSILRVDKKHLHEGYLLSYLVHPAIKSYIESFNSGGSRRAITKGAIESFMIPLPPLAEQKQIAHILGTIDAKIELNQRSNETLEDIAKALFKSWFVDFDPVRAKAEGRPTGLPDEISDLFPDSFEDSELGEIPSGWSVIEVGDCSLEIESGKRPKGGINKGLSSGVPSVGAESVDAAGVFDFGKTKYVSEDFASSATKGWVRELDVALYKDGGKPGEFKPRVAIYGSDFPFPRFMVNEHVFLLRSIELGQLFLYHLFGFDLVREQIIHMGSSKGAQPGLNQQEVKSSVFVKPNESILRVFTEVMEAPMSRQFHLGKQNLLLEQLRDALLPRLISGELRVPVAEKILKEAGI